MAAGLGFKTFVTGEVLTAADTNGYLMQGINVFADATARDAAITSPQEGQFAYLKDTNVTTYYTGSAWANVDTTGMTNPMTTTGDVIYSSSGSTPARLGIGTAGQVLKVNSGATAPEWAVDPVADVITTAGDLLYGTAADTVARLGIGTAGQVLTVNSGATAPEWAAAAGGGGMTLINTGGTTLSGATTTVSSIPGTYRNLYLVIELFKPATDGSRIYVRVNGDAGSNRYNNIGSQTGELTGAYNDTTWTLSLDQDNSVSNSIGTFTIFEYANTSIWKIIEGQMLNNDDTTSTSISFRTLYGMYNQTTAITSLVFFTSSGNFTSGTVYVYGVK